MSMLNTCGIVCMSRILPMGFIAVFCFMRIMISGGKLSISLLAKDKQDAVVVFGVTVMLFAQAMFVILGSCNVIPLAGLPIPFLSRGFTYLTIVFFFSGLLLHLSETGDDDEETVEYGGEIHDA